jgi:dihydrofolate reductase
VGKLIYSAICSLDGYVEDASGRFDWAAPDAEVHGFANELERPIGTHVYGRRMFETMVFWETAGREEDDPPVIRDFAELWRAADKIVISRTLEEVATPRTRLERELDPEWVRALKSSSDSDLSIGGATLAGQAIGMGLVDEIQLLLCPIVVGAGKRALPDDVLTRLELGDTRTFTSGVVFLRYRVVG